MQGYHWLFLAVVFIAGIILGPWVIGLWGSVTRKSA